jgi:hypothetical protein
MDEIGIRCLKCNTDVWCSTIQYAVKHCDCGDVNIALDGKFPIIGKRKGAPYLVLKKTPSGKIITQEPVDTGRAPSADLDNKYAGVPMLASNDVEE